MANDLLKPVFKKIFDKDFDAYSFEDRLEMQKSIYLLQDMGISVGDYRFMWYKHGPYSQTLQNDILNIKNTSDVYIKFSADAEKVIAALKAVIFKKDINYNPSQWIECLGSLKYIKDNILPSTFGDEKVLEELRKRKPHLNHDEENKIALNTLKELSM